MKKACPHQSSRRSLIGSTLGALLLGAGLGLAGCATSGDPSPSPTLSIIDSGDLAAAMAGVSHISIHPEARVVRPRPDQSPDSLRDVTDSAVMEVLRDRGYTMVLPGQGQRVIAYGIGIEGKLTDEEMVKIFGIAPGVDNQGGLLRGGVVLVLLDARTGEVLWRGSASAEVSQPSPDLETQRERIREAIDAVMAELPPRGTQLR